MTHQGMVVAGRFVIEDVAGKGGMGAIYRARDRATSEHAAVKIIDRSVTENRKERFAREVKLLAELAHPAIVRYLAHGVTERGEPFLAMELLEGEDLAARLRQQPLGAHEAVRLAGRVAEALGVAHGRGIVHRDIKPSNLFLVAGNPARVKVLDFGIAHVHADTMTHTGATIGTPGYMAPEQARGSRDLDARADVFSLGCVLFECLAGQPPFAGETAMAVLAKILLEDAPRLASLRPDLPPALDDLLARMLAKDPAERPSDGAAVAAELEVLGPLPDATAPAKARDSAVTIGEQRLVCLVFASQAVSVDETGTPVPETDTISDASIGTTRTIASNGHDRLLALRGASLAHGGHAELLADGSVVVTVFGRGAATDQAARAARCALAVRAVVPDAPMAFAMGRCAVGDRVPLGELIDRAARLLGAPVVATAPTAMYRAQAVLPIRVDETAAGLLDVRFVIDGDHEGLVLVGERDVAASIRTLLGKPTPCVGRERELAALAAIFDECVAEPMAHVVVVTAPAGVGKSRLRHELVARLAAHDIEIWIGSGDAMSPGAPFAMIAQALRRTAGIIEGEPQAVRHMKLRARVLRHVPPDDAPRITEFLGEMVGAPTLEEGSVQLRAARRDPQLMGDQMLRACEDFIAAECSAQPVLLVLEDLHWGDLPTVRFVDSVVRQLPDRPLMVVGFARPEVETVFPRLWMERSVQHIRLGELTKRAAERLVRDALGTQVDDATVARLVERSAGNAFYLEELIRAVADGKGDQMPATVIAMAQARIESLELEARHVLRAASIFGQTFWKGGVVQMLAGATTHAEGWLEELVARELVVAHRESRYAGELEFGFRHALVREAAYAMLTDRDRERGHRLAGEWLESKIRGERRGELRAGEAEAVALAEHFERGADPSRSVGWYRQAAEQALEGNDLASAIERAERAIACIGVGADPGDRELIGLLRQLQTDAHCWRGEYGLAVERGEEALARLRPASAAWLAALAVVADGCRRKLETARVTELCRILADTPTTATTNRGYANAVAMAMPTLLWRDEPALVERLFWRLERIEIEVGDVDPATLASIALARAWRAFHDGDLAGAYLLDSRTEQFHVAVGDLRRACQQRANVAYDEIQLGAYARAEQSLSAAIAVATRIGLFQVVNQARHNLGIALARLGRIDEARVVETLALEAFSAHDNHWLGAAARHYLAVIENLAGDHAAAIRHARDAIDAASDEPSLRCQFHATLSRAYRLSGDLQAALAHSRTAMELMTTHGRPEEGELDVYLQYAEALFATGAPEHARRVIGDAEARLLEIASKIRDPEWRTSFLEAIPENARTRALARLWKPT